MVHVVRLGFLKKGYKNSNLVLNVYKIVDITFLRSSIHAKCLSKLPFTTSAARREIDIRHHQFFISQAEGRT